MTTPIRPEQVAEAKQKALPESVLSAFNTLIARKWSNGRAVVTQNEAIAEIRSRESVSRQAVFDNGWLDVEDVYRAAGWHVEYDKPGYNEDYEAYFTFRKRTKDA